MSENTKEIFKLGNVSKFRDDQKDLNSFSNKNHLNDLNLADWLRRTSTYHLMKKRPFKDMYKSRHPASFEEELPFYYIDFFTKKNDIVLDPFMGTGSTGIASHFLQRKSIGIELNEKFLEIIDIRYQNHSLNRNNHRILKGDCFKILSEGFIERFLYEFKKSISFVITSPPYFNILKYTTNLKKDYFTKTKDYGDYDGNLEKIDDYTEFLEKLVKIFILIYNLVKNKGYLLINVQNFYRKVRYNNGKVQQEIVYFAWDLTNKIKDSTRWIPGAEQIWIDQDKKLFPFGYPYLYRANITHSYILIFQKDVSKK